MSDTQACKRDTLIEAWQGLGQAAPLTAQGWATRAQFFGRARDVRPELDMITVETAVRCGDIRSVTALLESVAANRPNFKSAWERLVVAYLVLGMTENAETMCRERLADASETRRLLAQFWLAVTYCVTGHISDAWGVVGGIAERIDGWSDNEIRKKSTDVNFQLGNFLPVIYAVLARMGQRDRAEQVKSRAARFAPTGCYDRACLAALRGNADEAIQLLEEEVRDHLTIFPEWWHIDPDFESIRDHPRFKPLIREAIDKARTQLKPGT